MADVVALPDLNPTLGVLEIGTVLAVFLTGITSLQVWNYFRDYGEDHWSIKSLVAGIFVGDCIHTAFLCHAVYYFTIIKFARYEDLLTFIWSLEVTMPLAGIIGFVVQSYFTVRVYRLTGYVAASACWILSIAALICNFLLTHRIVKERLLSVLEEKTPKAYGLAGLIISAMCDVLIACFLCAGLLRARSGFSQSNKLVDKLVAFTIGSGLLTSILAISEAITFAVIPSSVHIGFYCTLAKLYGNSLLASLNERAYTRRELSHRSLAQQHVSFERTTTVTRQLDGGMELETVNDPPYKGVLYDETESGPQPVLKV